MADPRSFIYGLIGALPSILSGAARSIADRIFSVFDDAIEFAKYIRSGWEDLFTKGSWAFYYIRNFAQEATTTVTWFIKQRIPALIAYAKDEIRTWTNTIITFAINGVKATLSTLDKWAKAAIATVTNALNTARSWLDARINAITSRLSQTVDKWYDRLTNPAKMAEWLFGALVAPFWRYIYNNRDKIVSWFLKSSPSFTEWLARELDAILRRIL
jgi:phage-related protein